MATKLPVKSEKIVEIFKSVGYQKMGIDDTDVKTWLQKFNNEIDIIDGKPYRVNDAKGNYFVTVYQTNEQDVIKNALETVEANLQWKQFTAAQKTTAMNRFASEIEQNCDLICKFEALSRGILPKDTKKYGVAFLKEYLHYYASWPRMSNKTQTDVAVLCLPDDSTLANLAFGLGPVLAHGSNIILRAGTQISATLAFLIELSVVAGIPDGTLKLLPGDCDVDLVTCCQPLTVYENGNIFKEVYDNPKTFLNKRIIAVSNKKTSMIIFNDADLDSACECAVSAIWEYQGLLPWAVNTIFVQEDIFSDVVEKLANRLRKLRIGDEPENTSDFFYCSQSQCTSLDKMIVQAKSQGIQVFQSNDTEKLQPTLFIGGKVYGNNVIVMDENDIPAGMVVAFRTAKEAASLANNTRQGLAVSVWCQNISLVNEIVRKLNVGTVWVNSHGVVKANVPFCTKKVDGFGVTGGPDGFYECEEQVITDEDSTVKNRSSRTVNTANVQKVEDSWVKLPLPSKIEKLVKWAEQIENNDKLKLRSGQWIEAIQSSIQELSTVNACSQVDNFDLKTYRDPVGIVILNVVGGMVAKLATGALLLGNIVLIACEAPNEHIEIIAELLKPNVLGTISTAEIPVVVENRRQGVVVIGNYFPLQRSVLYQKHYAAKDDYKFILRRCTTIKNVWTDIGESF